ncbi:copper resistance protein NlpE N-terminal domain-containing protein [Caldimonas brevitalea]|uniref:Proteinase inhibitor I42 chagasin domain-containing protein n=1 Tax=Caldimonas brevitalea TaxID=413882 RepID=A0A0G3BFK1_9BURK|nr:copper resistance protein NlpE N-terminal domain-containing protein [Caldimonas brevitalea]AKJ28097.1 hypothetical protein AAW51_1406 [Caldimonas brevitalea]
MMARLLPVLAAALALSGCASWLTRGDAVPVHQVPAGAVPAARFAGTLPCADCAGVRTDVQLFVDANGAPTTYSLLQTFLGASAGNRPAVVKGNWIAARGSAADAQASVIHLDPDNAERARGFRQVGPQVLRALDRDGNDLPGSLPRSLVRVPDDVPQTAVVLTYADRGSEAPAQADQQVVLLLASQPTSGFRWVVAPDRVGALVAQGEPMHVADPTPNAPGLDMFRFKAAGIGRQVIRAEYRAMGADPTAKAADTVSFDIVVVY